MSFLGSCVREIHTINKTNFVPRRTRRNNLNFLKNKGKYLVLDIAIGEGRS